MSERCPFGWKAAALEDGRLDGADRASFEAHASRCADCRAEQKAIVALYTRLRGLPSASLQPLEHARRRGALLERANERFVGRSAGAARRRWAVLALATVLLVGAISAVLLRRSSTSSKNVPIGATMAPRYDVVEGAHAVWRTRSDGSVARVELADGEATFGIEPIVPPQRFIVSLPDGEVEATAARFTADVALGRTRAITVAQGQVVLRRRDERDLTLRAGEGWSKSEAVAMTTAPRVGAPSAAVVSSAAAPSATTMAHGPPVHAAGSSASRVAATPPTSRRAGEKFEEAIGSFVHGAYARADVELHEFIDEFPHDARCEDASFLSAVARWRMGDGAGARSRAESYLATYPNGLRRNEAQHILDVAR